jgi:dTDP-4-amino-4,6-dideoxygalactose transaminase
LTTCSTEFVSNYSYFPILVKPNYHLKRDELFEKLKENGIYSRRYFYPLISNFPIYSRIESSNPENLVIANRISNEILCLPIYPELDYISIEKIISVICN